MARIHHRLRRQRPLFDLGWILLGIQSRRQSGRRYLLSGRYSIRMKKAGILLLILLLIGGGYWFFINQGAKSSVISIDKSSGYKLMIDGKPLLIKGVCYSPVPVGKDYEYNWWGDANKP